MGVRQALCAVYDELVRDTANDCVDLIVGQANGGVSLTRGEAEAGAAASVRERMKDVREGILAVLLGTWRKPLLARALSGQVGTWEKDLGIIAEMDWNFFARVRTIIEATVSLLEEQGGFRSEEDGGVVHYGDYDGTFPGHQDMLPEYDIL